jgi:hypothetical protein
MSTRRKSQWAAGWMLGFIAAFYLMKGHRAQFDELANEYHRRCGREFKA